MEGALTDLGWLWSHANRAVVPQKGVREGRWITPTTKGWPDLFALRNGYALACELKKDGEYPKPAQRKWLEAFHLVPGILVWVSRPSDPWDDLVGWLRHPETAPLVYGWEPAADKAARLANRSCSVCGDPVVLRSSHQLTIQGVRVVVHARCWDAEGRAVLALAFPNAVTDNGNLVVDGATWAVVR